ELTADELEQLQRNAVCPVEVVEDEHEPTASAQVLEHERSRVEELEARVLGAKTTGDDRRVGRLPNEPQDEISDLGGARPGRERFARARPQRLYPGPVRRRPASLPAAAPDDLRPTLGGPRPPH